MHIGQDPLLCGANLIMNNLNMVVLIISLITLAISFKKVRTPETRHRTVWLYLNAISFIFPFVFFLFSTVCAPASVACQMNSMLYSIPFAVIGSVMILFLAVSQLVKSIFGAKRIENRDIEHSLQDYCKTFGIEAPEVYLISEQKPFSFSSFGLFKQKIFFSVGLFELLTKKEYEAVLLHELHHVKKVSYFSKFSTYLLRIISPVLHFSEAERSLHKEEEEADAFAIKIQKTSRYLISAKRKIVEYETLESK